MGESGSPRGFVRQINEGWKTISAEEDQLGVFGLNNVWLASYHCMQVSRQEKVQH